jgi:cephalosporin hydroxylase
MDKVRVQQDYRAKLVQFEYYLGDILQIVNQTPSTQLEGNAFYYHNTQNRFAELTPKQMNLFWTGSQIQTRVCEIGFNAGHSALLLLSGCGEQPIQCTIFDIGHHTYTRPCLNYVQSQFPNANIQYIEGDSIQTMAKYIQANPTESGTYDVVHVDGGHSLECITADFAHATQLVRSGGIVIIDDTNIDYINTAVDKAIQSGLYSEIDCFPTVGYQHRLLRKSL